MTPVVHAVLGTNPDICPASVDLFACGSTLGNLLRFVRGMDRAFRFNVEVIGNTIFLIRKENDPKELIEDVRGFGHSFPEAYTTWEKEVKGTETHQRIVQYALGNLKCLVRFECDGYIKDAPTSTHTSLTKASSKTSDEHDLLQLLQGTTISRPFHATTSSTEALTVKNGGSEVPQRCIFDLKTRSSRAKGGINMDDIYPLLWLKQIPNFIAAYHDGYGLFNDIRVQDVRKEVQKWEKDNIDAIHRLSMLLGKIIKIAKQDARGLLEVYFSGAGGLEIRSQHGEGTHALPTELSDRWADNEAAHGVSGSDAAEDTDQKFYDFESYDGWNVDSDDEVLDYAACSAEDCGYCGKCMY